MPLYLITLQSGVYIQDKEAGLSLAKASNCRNVEKSISPDFVLGTYMERTHTLGSRTRLDNLR